MSRERLVHSSRIRPGSCTVHTNRGGGAILTLQDAFVNSSAPSFFIAE